MFLSVEDVCRLAGLTVRRLRYWERTRAFAAQHNSEKYPLVYTFRDLVGLRVLAILRDKGVALQELRKVGNWLAKEHETPWSSLRFYIDGKHVYFKEPKSGAIVAGRPIGQAILTEPFDLEPIAHSMSNAAERLRARDEHRIGTVEKRRGVMGGTWVVGGTRIPASTLWNFKEAGCSVEEILREYPTLSVQDVLAALAHEASRRKKAG